MWTESQNQFILCQPAYQSTSLITVFNPTHNSQFHPHLPPTRLLSLFTVLSAHTVGWNMRHTETAVRLPLTLCKILVFLADLLLSDGQEKPNANKASSLNHFCILFTWFTAGHPEFMVHQLIALWVSTHSNRPLSHCWHRPYQFPSFGHMPGLYVSPVSTGERELLAVD